MPSAGEFEGEKPTNQHARTAEQKMNRSLLAIFHEQ